MLNMLFSFQYGALKFVHTAIDSMRCRHRRPSLTTRMSKHANNHKNVLLIFELTLNCHAFKKIKHGQFFREKLSITASRVSLQLLARETIGNGYLNIAPSAACSAGDPGAARGLSKFKSGRQRLYGR